MSDPLDRLAWTTEVPTEPGVYVARHPGDPGRPALVRIHADRFHFGNEEFPGEALQAPALQDLKWCRVPDRGEANYWRHRALEHCACYVSLGRPASFDPRTQPCACTLSDCERDEEGCCD